MASHTPSVLDIKRAKKDELVQIAETHDISLDGVTRVTDIRDLLIQELWSDETEVGSEVSSVVDQLEANVGSRNEFTFEQTLVLRKLEREKEERDREREREKEERDREKDERHREERALEREREREERALDREREREREEREHEIALRRLDQRGVEHERANGQFRLNDCYRSLPNWDDKEIDRFFSMFERVASDLEWPRRFWYVLVASKFKDRASEAYNALDSDSARDYDLVKEAVLLAYALTPEAYRQKYREIRKSEKESYCEFAARQEGLLDQWIKAEKVGSDFASLKQLISLEAFSDSLSSSLRVHLADLGVKAVKSAAVAADNYVLVHKPQGNGYVPHKFLSSKQGNDRGQKPGYASFQSSFGNQSRPGAPATNNRVGFVPLSANAKPFQRKCTYCKLDNHTVDFCFARKRAMGNVVSFVSLHQEESCTDSRYISQGRLGTIGSKRMKSVVVYRDTGSFQTLVSRDSLVNPDQSDTGRRVIIKAICGPTKSVPLHRVNLETGFVNGEVIVGVVDTLPIANVQVLLGCDLAKSCCGNVKFPQNRLIESSSVKYYDRNNSQVTREGCDLAGTIIGNQLGSVVCATVCDQLPVRGVDSAAVLTVDREVCVSRSDESLRKTQCEDVTLISNKQPRCESGMSASVTGRIQDFSFPDAIPRIENTVVSQALVESVKPVTSPDHHSPNPEHVKDRQWHVGLPEVKARNLSLPCGSLTERVPSVYDHSESHKARVVEIVADTFDEPMSYDCPLFKSPPQADLDEIVRDDTGSPDDMLDVRRQPLNHMTAASILAESLECDLDPQVLQPPELPRITSQAEPNYHTAEGNRQDRDRLKSTDFQSGSPWLSAKSRLVCDSSRWIWILALQNSGSTRIIVFVFHIEDVGTVIVLLHQDQGGYDQTVRRQRISVTMETERDGRRGTSRLMVLTHCANFWRPLLV